MRRRGSFRCSFDDVLRDLEVFGGIGHCRRFQADVGVQAVEDVILAATFALLGGNQIKDLGDFELQVSIPSPVQQVLSQIGDSNSFVEAVHIVALTSVFRVGRGRERRRSSPFRTFQQSKFRVVSSLRLIDSLQEGGRILRDFGVLFGRKERQPVRRIGGFGLKEGVELLRRRNGSQVRAEFGTNVDSSSSLGIDLPVCQRGGGRRKEKESLVFVFFCFVFFVCLEKNLMSFRRFSV